AAGEEVRLDEVGSAVASADAAARAHAAKGKGVPKAAIFGGGAVLLLALAGGGYVLTRPKPADSDAEAKAAAAAPAEPKQAAAKPPPPEDTPDEAPPVKAAAETPKAVDPAAAKALETGKQLLGKGKFAEAEKELAKAEQGGAEGAAALLARAREGIDSSKQLAEAQKRLAAKDLTGARVALALIPDDSVLGEKVTQAHEQLAAAEAKLSREQDAQAARQEALAARAAADEERKRKAEEEKAAREEERRRKAEEEKLAREEAAKKAALAAATPKKTATPTSTNAVDKAQVAEDIKTGKELLKKQKPKDAAAIFEKVLAADASAADAHMYLGSCYAMMGDLKKAAEHYEKFVRMRPDAPQAPMIRDNLKKYYDQYGGN
ncbi:MAG: tetratricopeptide repeat protein, partial [Myxococcales bacterium]